MVPFVITIGRELGSGGKTIGNILSEKLGVPVYDRTLIRLAAKESGISEDTFNKIDEISDHGLFSFLIRPFASPFGSLSAFYSNSMSNESLFKLQTEIIEEKARTENCIIVGRCSDYILRNHPRHLNVFIRANMDDRIKLLCDREIIGKDSAEQQIRNIDKKRAEYHDFYCETTWGDSRSYDLCVNSSLLGLEKTAEFILQYAKEVLKID